VATGRVEQGQGQQREFLVLQPPDVLPSYKVSATIIIRRCGGVPGRSVNNVIGTQLTPIIIYGFIRGLLPV
jgi:hypothetical protein